MLTEQGVLQTRFIERPGAFYVSGDTLMLYTIHILLVIAVIVVLVKLFTGRNVV
jgi:hypothetical protein